MFTVFSIELYKTEDDRYFTLKGDYYTDEVATFHKGFYSIYQCVLRETWVNNTML